MQVCDICYGEPQFSGRPKISAEGQSGEQYLFGSVYKNNLIDLCKECRDALKNRNWDELAKRQKQVVQQHLITESTES